MSWTALLLLGALGFAVAGLAAAWARTNRWASPSSFSAPRGRAAAGVSYELTTAFLPWTKESARAHLPTYLGGVVFHLGVFAALVLALATLIPTVGTWLVTWRPVLLGVFLAGLATGLGLLAKRLISPRMRGLSWPEDYLANLLADAMLASALLALFRPDLLTALHVTAALLLVYLPLGKLRHVIFLFLARLHLGRHFGRRGVLPPRAEEGR